jgi:serine/threonine-protein kinase HipA
MNRCLICTKQVPSGTAYHLQCSKSFFGTETPPVMPYGMDDLDNLAGQLVSTHITIPGVQKKLSLATEQQKGERKLTFVGLWGNYILKPPVKAYSNLPENEHLSMMLAQAAGIRTVPFALIRMRDGVLAYITRRIDRDETQKLPMEDACQLSGKLTEEKYRGSVEQVGKLVLKHCANRGFDALRLFEVVVFSFLTGNNDMHLKNFSVIGVQGEVTLAPAYDLLNTRLVIPETEDPDETALTINGKRKNLTMKDFQRLRTAFGLTEKQVENVFKRMKKADRIIVDTISASFLPEQEQMRYLSIYSERRKRLGI